MLGVGGQSPSDALSDRVNVVAVQGANARHPDTVVAPVCQSCEVTLHATLFDMDGLLFDTEVLWLEAEVEIFGRLGVPIDEAKDRLTKGVYIDKVVADWRALFPWEGPSNAEVVSMLIERVTELVTEKGRIMPGALRALDLASERGPIALASSTPLVLIHRILHHFDLASRFASIHSAEFETYAKPHPGVFLTAAASLNVAPERCLVFEDSAFGVLAAKSALMAVVAVPTPLDSVLPTFAIADLVLRSLEELTPEWLDERFA